MSTRPHDTKTLEATKTLGRGREDLGEGGDAEDLGEGEEGGVGGGLDDDAGEGAAAEAGGLACEVVDQLLLLLLHIHGSVPNQRCDLFGVGGIGEDVNRRRRFSRRRLRRRR